MVTGREWELNLRHHGIGNGNELMGMEGNGDVANHSRTSVDPREGKEFLATPLSHWICESLE